MGLSIAEQVARTLAGFTRRSKHSQLCPVWVARPRKEILDTAVRLLEDLERCDCWIMSGARMQAAALREAGLLRDVSEGDES